ncbi:NUDIX domain-containing protein [Streptomyces sp. NPDC058045]|uniref:NUDIX domain-containing protein n=1 Tax=Streptomyces sp. NPDC058045 TaxID=3346311 RepID=UPI0036E3CA00
MVVAEDARWRVHGSRREYRSPWLEVRVSDVEQPDGTRVDYHHVVLRRVAVAAVVVDGRVLMLWRHRFLTGTWAWELPMGLVEDGETPAAAAAREAEEETGWRPGPLRPLVYAEPWAGISDSEHHVLRADSATRVGDPVERNEAGLLRWVPLGDLRGMIRDRRIVSSATLVGVLTLLLDETPDETPDAAPDGAR